MATINITGTLGKDPELQHGQNTGNSPGRMVTASPKSGLARSAMPMAAGSPTWTGAP